MPEPPPPPQERPRPEWQPLLLLAVLAVGLHAHGIGLGFFLDDNNHLELCARNGYAGLARGNTFRWNREILRVWWAGEETGWAYFRPLTVLLRTAQLQVFGLNPVAFHLVHLALYAAVVLLLYGLLRRLGLGQGAALVGGAFFTLHPVHAQVGPWLASDTSVLAALGFVLALWVMRASQQVGHARPGLWVGVLACYAVALLARESGLMLGPVLVLFDWLLAGRAVRGRPWGLYALLALEGVAYLGLRWLCLEPAPLPREPCLHWPTHPGFAAWLPYKLLTDLASVPSGLLLVPVLGESWIQARPGATVVAAAIVLVTAGLFCWPLRGCRAARGVVAGTALVALPTLLICSIPYNYYLTTACWAAVLALWTRRLWPTRPWVVGGGLTVLALLYLAGLGVSAWEFHHSAYAEHTVAAEVVADGAARYPPGARVFVVDLPLFASEVGPAVRLQTGRPDLEFFALTYSPKLFALRGATQVVQEDDRTLLLRRSDDGWFAGSLGQDLQLSWFGATREGLKAGAYTPKPAAGELPFRVEVVDRTERGIRALRFVFDRPLNDPSYHFFVGTPRRTAQPWRPGQQVTLSPPTAPVLRRLNGRLRWMQKASDLTLDRLSRMP